MYGWICYLLLLPLLALLVYQDFKDRAIDWHLPLWFWLLAWGWHVTHLSRIHWLFIGVNLGFILFQLLVLTLYFSIKSGRWIDISRQQLGWGDILFFIPLCWFFSPVHFIVFFVVSLLSILLLMPLVGMLIPKQRQSIPLAGAMSILLAIWLGIAKGYGINIYDDLMIIHQLHAL